MLKKGLAFRQFYLLEIQKDGYDLLRGNVDA